MARVQALALARFRELHELGVISDEEFRQHAMEECL